VQHEIAIRCGACRGGGWLRGWFRRCRWCKGRGWFDAVSAPAGLGPLVAASEAVRSDAARALLVRPALPWERFPVPPELKARDGAPDEATWERAVRASAVILYDLGEGRTKLAGGLELARLPAHHEAMRAVFWSTADDGGLWRCVDGRLRDVYLRLSFFRAWRGEWVELTRHDVARPVAPPPVTPAGEARKYVTGKLFVGPPKEES
jgi:hypothetical protein